MNRILSRTLPLLRQFRELLDDQRGTTAIEYAMIAVGVSIGILAAVVAIGSTLNTGFYTAIVNALASL